MFRLWNVSNAKYDPESFVIVDQPNSQCRDKIPEVFELPKLCGLDLFETSVDELQHYLSIGSFDSVAYTQFCLENIRKANPYLECVIETNPDALEIARTLDQERKDGQIRGPLHGIPVLIKDVSSPGANTELV
ncbi:hypothetical protein LTS08_004416 [Lithohypha guttulata]|uniref:uncharacterized protein n=1 Tax=Lithohypha guttulata TaxID=1690604 RepID=UPI002DE1C23E|nr:hypothetical protein LTR51_007620 [Lithohypha guttulata]KAK5101957.1 hypothetical protein LTS08_004416 [Lithohypha guttulata]